MQKRRRRGACLQCARRKRKCDHKQPRCTQCVKHGETCELQTFKVSTPSIFNSKQTTNGASPITQPSQPVAETSASQILPETPVPITSPEGLADGSADQDMLDATTTIDIVPDLTSLPTIADSAHVESLLGQPRPDTSHGTDNLLGTEATYANAFAGSSQPTFVDLGETEDPVEDVDNSSLMSLFTPNIDNHGLEGVMGRDITHNATELLSSMRDLSGRTFVDPLLGFGFDNFLYCPMPWPADMLASSERRFLWQYFLSSAEDFLCLDWDEVGHLYGFQHPYITTLPQMALSNDALRSAIFCYAASQHQLRYGRRDFERTKNLTSAEAAMALSTRGSQATDDSNLLSMISAATLLNYFGAERHDYLRIASRLVSQYLARHKSSSDSGTTTCFTEVPLTEFRWSVISTLCSLQQPSSPLGSQIYRMIEMSEDEIKQNYSRAFQRWVSHPIYTFSPRLVNPLLRIGRLLETQLVQLADADMEADPSWASQVSEAEDMLLHARDCDVNASESALGTADPVSVVALNETMYAAGAILVYARLQGLPATAPFIRRQTQIISEEIMKIPANSRVCSATVFPLFIAGCEAIEQQMRNSIIERIREPGGVTYDRGDLVGALKHIWDIRDLEPGLPWPLWVKKGE